MKQWTKWKVLDYRAPNRHREARFDEVVQDIANGELGASDFVCPPHWDHYKPITHFPQLEFVLTKALDKLHQKETLSGSHLEACFELPVNKRTAFVQENYFFSSYFKNKKLKLLEQCAPYLLRILKPKEEINYILSATADVNLSRWVRLVFPKSCLCLESLVIFTNMRIIQAFWNPTQRRIESVKSVKLKHINHFVFSEASKNHFRLELSLFKKRFFNWVNISSVDKIQVTPLLQAFIKKDLSFKELPANAWIPNLCYTCFSSLEPESNHCFKCNAEYKSPSKALTLSTFIPAMGCFYSGFKTLGAISIFGELLLFSLLIYGMSITPFISPWRMIIISCFSFLLVFGHRQCALSIENLVREIRPHA